MKPKMQPLSVETPRRPRPPAKVRRSMAKGSTTPPPAYAPTFAFPTTGNEIDEPGTKWDVGNALGDGPEPENPDDDLDWLNEKSREELTDLLVKADALIKERESELSLTSAACKNLYESNVVLKTKHEALLNKIPLSPNVVSNTISSPDLSSSSHRPAFASLGRSASEYVISDSPQEHMLSKSHNYNPRRGISAPSLDISFLADQNAELLSKLEKLETEASSADVAGRRELRRLEKEIGVLKEELEKTQARSSELEEKAKTGFGLGAEKVIEEAWKRKKEREARLKAIRNLKSGWGTSESSTVQNFAPDAPSLFRGTALRQYTGPDLSTLEETSISSEDAVDAPEPMPPANPSDQLFSKLLQKIQELETTNSKILEHQTETTSRLQAVQRETEFMTRVYERLNEFDPQPDHDETEAQDQVSESLVHKFSRSQRGLESQLLAAKVTRQRSFNKHEVKHRGTIMGLFDELAPDSSTPHKPRSNLPVPFGEGSWHRPRHHSSYSIGSGGLASPALSTLSLYSPPARLREELSPDVMMGPNLANELGDQWGGSDYTSRLRPRSLSDASVLSASPSPAPSELPPAISRRKDADNHSLPTPSGPTNSLQLSVEPPTPQKVPPITQHQESLLIGNMSPRFRTSRSLRSRNGLYIDGRYPEPQGPRQTPHKRMRFAIEESSPTPSRGPSGGPLLVEAFQVIMDEFDGQGAGQDDSRSPSPDAEVYADAKEEQDEADRGPKTANLEMKAGMREEEESYSEENSLSARSQTSEVIKPTTLGSIMLECWMWLQFAIIMLVFLWAMARKGPKSVLKDAERKRTLSIKKRA